jgi:hypothetical protein
MDSGLEMETFTAVQLSKLMSFFSCFRAPFTKGGDDADPIAVEQVRVPAQHFQSCAAA